MLCKIFLDIKEVGLDFASHGRKGEREIGWIRVDLALHRKLDALR